MLYSKYKYFDIQIYYPPKLDLHQVLRAVKTLLYSLNKMQTQQHMLFKYDLDWGLA